jgi:hypothetical protein
MEIKTTWQDKVKASNDLPYIYIVEWEDGTLEQFTCAGKEHALKQVKMYNGIRNVNAAAFKFSIGHQIA